MLYVRDWTEGMRRYQRIAQVDVHAVGRLSDFLTVPTTKIVVTGEIGVLDGLAAALGARFDGRLYIAKSLPFFLGIASPEVSKSHAHGERAGGGPPGRRCGLRQCRRGRRRPVPPRVG